MVRALAENCRFFVSTDSPFIVTVIVNTDNVRDAQKRICESKTQFALSRLGRKAANTSYQDALIRIRGPPSVFVKRRTVRGAVGECEIVRFRPTLNFGDLQRRAKVANPIHLDYAFDQCIPLVFREMQECRSSCCCAQSGDIDNARCIGRIRSIG